MLLNFFRLKFVQRISMNFRIIENMTWRCYMYDPLVHSNRYIHIYILRYPHTYACTLYIRQAWLDLLSSAIMLSWAASSFHDNQCYCMNFSCSMVHCAHSLKLMSWRVFILNIKDTPIHIQYLDEIDRVKRKMINGML